MRTKLKILHPSPLAEVLKKIPLAAKYQPMEACIRDRLIRHSMPVPECGCWIWLSSTNKGYGQLSSDKGGPPLAAHRASYAAFVGPIPNGAHVLHKCNMPACINPDHLYLGTDKENTRDRIAAGRQAQPPRLIGEAHPQCRLTEANVKEILSSRDRGIDLAKKFGVSKVTISAIKKRRIWRWI